MEAKKLVKVKAILPMVYPNTQIHIQSTTPKPMKLSPLLALTA